MRSVRAIVAVAVATLILGPGAGSAAPVVVLEATFDLDTPGAAPDPTLPGGPAGDSLILRDDGGVHEVVASALGLENQPLVMDRQDDDTFGLQAIVPDDGSRDCGRYTVSWWVSTSESVCFMPCTIRDSRGRIIGSLSFRGNGLLTYNYAKNELSVGYTPGVPMHCAIELDFATRMTTLYLDGVAVPEAMDHSFRELIAEDVRMFHFSPACTDTYQFVVDDIRIEGDDCDLVPTRRTSWSAVKATYATGAASAR